MAPRANGEPPRKIWIDTDAACGLGMFKDIDDCLAVALLLTDPAWDVVGVSSIFGNAPVRDTDRVLRSFVTSLCDGCVDVYRGAAGVGHGETSAAKEIALALEHEPLTVFMLGPSTNVASALKLFDGQLHRHKFVAIAGTRKRVDGFRVTRFSPVRLRDLNYAKDTDAFEDLLERGIDLTLMPFELAQQVTMRRQHIDSVESEHPSLGAEARRWRWVWLLFLGKNGFHTFDAVSVSVLLPDHAGLSCLKAVAAGVELRRRFWRAPKRILHVSTDSGPYNVSYCYGISSDFADSIANRLGSASGTVSRAR